MYIQGELINPDFYYRIKNDFEGSNDVFWYNFDTQVTRLDSYCQIKDKAAVYKGEYLIEKADIIKRQTDVKIIKV